MRDVGKPAPAAVDDADLIVAVAAGDGGSLKALYERHAPRLFALVRHILPHQGEAEDVLHDVFIEAWQRAGDYDAARGSVPAWLNMRARSRALDRLRQTRWTPVAFLPDLPSAAEDPVAGPDHARVRQRLTQLPPGQREVLELSYFGGLSGSEIAARLGIPLGTVKTRAAAALSRMRTALGVGS